MIALIAFFTVVAPVVDRRMNRVLPGAAPADEAALPLHRESTIADLHADALLWSWDLNDRHSNGHVDLPRLREGNVALQAFSVVSKTPRGINHERNEATTDIRGHGHQAHRSITEPRPLRSTPQACRAPPRPS